jgi:hypothetical protein
MSFIEGQPFIDKNGEFFSKLQPVSSIEKRKPVEKAGSAIKTKWQNPETGQKQLIEVDLEKNIEEQKWFYRDKPDFEINESAVREIWNEHHAEIQKEIEKYGYDSILIVPDKLPEEEDLNRDLIETIKEGAGEGKVAATKYWAEQKSIGSAKEKKYRIILVHSAQNLADHPLLKVTKGKNIMDLTGLSLDEVKERIEKGQKLPVNFEAELNGQKIQIQAEGLSLEEYEIFQRMYFEKSQGKHLDEKGWTRLLKSFSKSSSGSRVVGSSWDPADRQLIVAADGPARSHAALGLRLSRSFSN